MGWVAARLRAGPIPALRSLWHGPFSAANGRAAGGCCERCERPKDARNAAWGRRRWFLPMGCVVYPGIYAARCDAAWRVWDGISWDMPAVGAGLPRPRRVRPRPPRQARPRARRSRHGCGAAPCTPRVSVASVQRMRETRLGAGGGGFCRWVAWYIPGYMRRVVMRYGVAWRVWDGISWDMPAVGAGLPRPRRVRPLPPRQARPRARRSRHGGGSAPYRRA